MLGEHTAAQASQWGTSIPHPPKNLLQDPAIPVLGTYPREQDLMVWGEILTTGCNSYKIISMTNLHSV